MTPMILVIARDLKANPVTVSIVIFVLILRYLAMSGMPACLITFAVSAFITACIHASITGFISKYLPEDL